MESGGRVEILAPEEHVAEEALKKIQVTGGSPMVLTEGVIMPTGMDWFEDAIFFSQSNDRVLRVSENGGTPETVVEPPSDEQFGSSIGSFQALKHKCADMMVAVETARSAAYYASSVAALGEVDS